MERGYKFRIYPDKKQIQQIMKTFGCCRFVWNYYLQKHKDMYEAEHKTLNYYGCCADMTQLKQSLNWLYEVDNTALQSSLQDLDTAFQNFFRRVKQGKKPGYPCLKSKRADKQSYRCKNNGKNVRVCGANIRLPKLGNVKCKITEEVQGRILSATVSRDQSGKFFVSLCCTDVEFELFPKTGLCAGLDFGIKSLIVTSDEEKYSNHKYLSVSERKLKHAQRCLSRKSKGSHRSERARVKLAKIHERIANQRKDTLHKISTDIVRRYDIICIEDLDLENMIRNHNLAKHIVDASLGELRRQLEYKAAWYGKKIVSVGQFFPSSQLCSKCGAKWSGTKDLSVREWICQECGEHHDRDVNAAKNILTEGLRIMA